mmetsp:Transcript_71445/g.190492  ORF Transcript_71445/g.190492 Transcript_71445/m.190492 type:complete len:375 (+) Transcript_71445:37-1161(+)
MALQQLCELFPSWESEALEDALTANKGDLQRTVDTLIEWTSNDAPGEIIQTSAAAPHISKDNGDVALRFDFRLEALGTQAATGWRKASRADLVPRHHNSVKLLLSVGEKAALSEGWSIERSRYGLSQKRDGQQGCRVQLFVGKQAVDGSYEPQVVKRGRYDSILAARLERKCPPKALGEVLKAALILKRHAKKAHFSQSQGVHPKSQFESPAAASHQQAGQLSREDKIVAGKALLSERLAFLKLVLRKMSDDGNCQFRALAMELYGSQDWHLTVRKRVVLNMARNQAEYQMYVGTEQEWRQYLEKMKADSFWGDELSLRSAADAYNIIVHVITTEEENWLLQYHPKASDGVVQQRAVFLAYTAPVHYDVVGMSR